MRMKSTPSARPQRENPITLPEIKAALKEDLQPTAPGLTASNGLGVRGWGLEVRG